MRATLELNKYGSTWRDEYGWEMLCVRTMRILWDIPHDAPSIWVTFDTAKKAPNPEARQVFFREAGVGVEWSRERSGFYRGLIRFFVDWLRGALRLRFKDGPAPVWVTVRYEEAQK